MTATVNTAYVEKAIAGALADFDGAAGPGNLNDPLFVLSCRLLELSHAAPDVLSEPDAETLASDRASTLGHDAASIRDTWKSALRHVGSTAAHVPAPTYTNGAHHAARGTGFADLAAYAQSRGVPAETFERAGWSDSELFEYEYPDPKTGKPERALTDQQRLVYLRRRRALRFETDAGPRWRLIDEDKPRPKYWHAFGAHQGAARRWYRLAEAVGLAYVASAPLVLCNGEASTVAAQHWGVAATAEAGGGEKEIPAHLLTELVTLWPVDRPVVVALDCDGKGHKAALQKAAQLRQAGYTDVRAVDLNLGQGEDLADVGRLHQMDALAYVLACPDLIVPQAAQAPHQGQSAAPAGPVTQSQAIINQLARLGYTFKLNLCTQTVEVNGEALTDQRMHVIRNRLRDEGRRQFGAVEDAIQAYAERDAYHPVRDYLLGLTWDGVERIARLAACLASNDPDVVYADGTACTLASVYLHRWLVGAVGKVLDQRQQAMLVLLGPQRIGKSFFAAWLCPPALAAYFIEETIDPKDKDSKVRLMSKFLWEVAELDATTRKADVAQLKQFISQKFVTVRRSYARYDTEAPALASLIGTVNADGFLADDTGNRRFFVLSLTGIDRQYHALDIDQIWAEAVARYRRGEPWELLDEEAEHQARQNRQYYAETPLHDYIRRHFLITRDPTHRMTAADMIDHLRLKDVPLQLSDHQIAIQLGRVAASLGLERVRDANGRYYAGLMERP